MYGEQSGNLKCKVLHQVSLAAVLSVCEGDFFAQ